MAAANDNRGYILVVDDDEDIGEAIELILETRGYRCVIARDGEAALEVMRTDPLPRIVLLDMMMPVMSGEEFRIAQLADARLATVPVIVMTADATAEDRAMSLGVSKFLRKPLRIDELISAMQAAA
jgi:two-component system, chemotaxis family, chemotaxis protein CheY